MAGGITTDGFKAIAAAVILDDSIDPFDQTKAYLGVGNGTAAFAVAQTDLQGASKARGKTDSVSRANAVISMSTTFSDAQAAFAWDEWGVFNASTGGTMLLRDVVNLGTKPNDESWSLNVSFEFVPCE